MDSWTRGTAEHLTKKYAREDQGADAYTDILKALLDAAERERARYRAALDQLVSNLAAK